MDAISLPCFLSCFISLVFGPAVNSSQVKKYTQAPALTFIPNNAAIKKNGALEKMSLGNMVKYVGFNAIMFPPGKAPLGPKALLKMKAGTSMKTQEGGIMVKVSAPGKTPIKLRGKKPVVANVIKTDLFTSSTLVAMGIDDIMTPSDM